MRIAVLVKQVPKFEEMELGPDGRLKRDGIELEMNPYCRRAVSKAVELAAERDGSHVSVFTLGPPAADDALREAIAWGLARGVDIDGVLITDTAFAGSDTLITATALARALEHEGPFDLVLAGRNSVDADTGQVGPELAELLDLPFLTSVRYLEVEGTRVHARCEHDDGWLQAEVELPAIVSTAERLCEPAKVDPDERARVPAARIRRLGAAHLHAVRAGDASPTSVGPVKVMAATRAHVRWPGAPLDDQVRNAVHMLTERGALRSAPIESAEAVAMSRARSYCTMVLCEPDRAHMTRELLGAAQRLTGNVVAVTVDPPDAKTLMSWGADEIVHLIGDNIEEDVANAVVGLVASDGPWALLAGSTAWGREVASRVAARVDAGLVGDAVELDVEDDRLIAWKPAFGGQIVAAITYNSPLQLATVRAGVLPRLAPRAVDGNIAHRTLPMRGRGRVRVLARTRDDDLDVLAEADTVIGVGIGVAPEEYPTLEPLRTLLRAELGATRKVTDKGWLPRARQIGLTGRAIAPRLYVSIGASGKFNHSIGIRGAHTVLAINPDQSAPIFDAADVGIVGGWREVLPLLVDALRDQLAAAG